MEKLLQPDIGLMVWTVVTFLIMVAILKKIAWGPLLKVLEDREEKIKMEVAAAEKHRAEMERLKTEYETQLLGIESRARALLSEAEQKGSEAREAILKDAEAQAKKIEARTRAELLAEKERLVLELRSQVGDLSVEIAEKLMRQSLDKKVQDRIVSDFIKNLDAPSGKLQ
jgi:F-type H+-transporting ATPase subunit b